MDTALDLTTLVLSITVGSWPSLEQMAVPPHLCTVLQVRYSSWLPEYIEAAESTVAGHPQWIGAEPVCPSRHHLFNMDLRAWVDSRTLQDLKAAKRSEIKQARNTAELGNFTYNGKVLNGDLNAQRRLAAYISVSKSALASGTEFSAAFTLANNTETVFTAQDFVGIELAKVMAVATVFAQGVQLRTAIEAAQTVEAIEAISWTLAA